MSDKVLNRYISPLDAETQRRSTPSPDGVETDFRSALGRPQLTIYGHIVPPLVDNTDIVPPTPLFIDPPPYTFPFGLNVGDMDIVVTFDEDMINFEQTANWLLSGAAAATLSVLSVQHIGANVYRVRLLGAKTEGPLTLTLNPPGAVSPVSDTAGNPAPTTSWPWYIDLTRPQITQVEPPTDEILYADVNFFGELKVHYSEFLGTSGQEISPAELTHCYKVLFLDESGDVISEQRPVVSLTKNEEYAFGDDDGKTVAKLTFQYTVPSRSASTFKLRILNENQLVDRAGNDLLADVLEYDWSIGQVDSIGPDWDLIDPSELCDSIPRPVELEPGLFDGLAWITIELSEAVPDGPITNPSNWLISDVDSAYEVHSVEKLTGNRYRAIIHTNGLTDSTTMSVTLSSSVVDMAGNPFSGSPFTVPLEMGNVAISAFTPQNPAGDWDGEFLIEFTSGVAAIAPSKRTSVWEAKNTSTGVKKKPSMLQEIKNDEGVIVAHKIVFSESDKNALKGDGGGVIPLQITHNYDNNYTDVDGVLMPNMVRGFASSKDPAPDKSCGGAGVPLGSDSSPGGWKPFDGEWIDWTVDTQGPHFVSADPASTTLVDPVALATSGITLKWDSNVDWTDATYSGSCTLTGQSASEQQITLKIDCYDLEEGDKIEVRMSGIKDEYGNPGDDGFAVYTVRDASKPYLSKVDPATAINLCHPETDELVLTFSEEVKAEYVDWNDAFEFFYTLSGVKVPPSDLSVVTATQSSGTTVKVLLKGGSSNNATNSVVSIRCSDGIVDAAGNTLDQSITQPFSIAVCETMRAPENLDAVVHDLDDRVGISVDFDPPSTGLTPTSYDIFIAGVLELSTSSHGSTHHIEGDWPVGGVEVKVRGTKGATLGPFAYTEVKIEAPAPELVIHSARLVGPDGKQLNTSGDSANYAPRYNPEMTHGENHWFAFNVESTGGTTLDFYFISKAFMKPGAARYAFKTSVMPPGLADAVDNAEWPSTAEAPYNSLLPTGAEMKDRNWVFLGTTRIEADDPALLGSNVAQIPNERYYECLEEVLAYLGDESNGPEAQMHREWYEMPMLFGDVMLFAVSVRDQETGESSEWKIFGADDLTALKILPEPMHDHPDWGVENGKYPFPELSWTGTNFKVEWADHPSRGVYSIESYQVGLFMYDGDEWRPMELGFMPGSRKDFIFDATPSASSSAKYMARVVPSTAQLNAWTDVNWDEDGTGYMEMTQRAFREGWGGRSQQITVAPSTGKEFTLDDAQPSHQAVIKNMDGTLGLKALFRFSLHVEDPGDNTYQLQVAELGTSSVRSLIYGHDYKTDKVADDAHQISFMRDVEAEWGQFTVNISFKDVRSTDGASFPAGYIHKINFSRS